MRKSLGTEGLGGSLTYDGFRTVPTGFIPQQDKGYLVVNAQLPDGASLERSEEVARRIVQIAQRTAGVQHILSFPGYSILTSSNLPNCAGMFFVLTPFEERAGKRDLYADAIAAELSRQFAEIQEALIVVFGAPPIDGLGSTGGVKMQVQDRGSAGYAALQGTLENFMEGARSEQALVGAFSSFRATQPQLYLDIDRVKAKTLGLDLSSVFDALQV